MFKLKQTICLIMGLVMLLLAVSCGTAPAAGDETTPAPSADTQAPAPVETEPPIPENERDTLREAKYDGADFIILSRKNTAYEVNSTEVTGDLVKDAVFNRNTKVAERFGVNITVAEQAGEWADRETFITKVGSEFMSGGNTYDLIMTHSAYIVNIGINGYAYNMAELEDIDFNKKWWCPQYTTNVNIGGKIFSAVGDLTYSLYERMQCMFFNKTITADNNIPDLYELVNNGEWTFDKMKEFALAVGSDLDGNGKYDDNDLYGLGLNNHTCRMFQTTFDTGMTERGDDGKFFINLPNERYIDVYNNVLDLKGQSQVQWTDEADTQSKLFINEKIMLFPGRLGNAVAMKEMTSEYGIIPFPKYDAAQENYISGARDYMTAMAVFANLADPAKTGLVTEALCMYGYQDITPAYYETTLKYRYLNDPTSMSMLDLIRDSLTFDFCMTYTNCLNTMYSTMGDSIKNGASAISTQLKANAKSWQRSLDKLYEDYENLK